MLSCRHRWLIGSIKQSSSRSSEKAARSPSARRRAPVEASSDVVATHVGQREPESQCKAILDNAKAGCSAEQSQLTFAISHLTWCGGRFCVLSLIDDEARGFVTYVELADPWAAITEPLPESFYDLDALKRLRPIVYAVIHAFTLSLDDSL